MSSYGCAQQAADTFVQDGDFTLPESAAILRYLTGSADVPDHWYPRKSLGCLISGCLFARSSFHDHATALPFSFFSALAGIVVFHMCNVASVS